MVFGGIHDAVLLVQVDHRRLNVGVAQHGLDLPDGGAMVQGQRRRGMAQRMGLSGWCLRPVLFFSACHGRNICGSHGLGSALLGCFK